MSYFLALPHFRCAWLAKSEYTASRSRISFLLVRSRLAGTSPHQQYQEALKDGAAFHQRYPVTPIEVKDPSGRKAIAMVTDDEGIYATTAEGLARLRPVQNGGTVTYGTQTHPADGNCGMVITSRERARELSRDRSVEIQMLAFGQARAKRGFMAQATVPAALSAWRAAGITIADVKAIKTHNPFAVNDIYLAREFEIPPESFNHYGSSLIFGHPQGPTGMRLVIELIEELVILGGCYGIFVGCAAGDTGAAIVVKVHEV